jgi:acyl-CoA synthetase (AMP-forming)/AMP-acid ligase II
MDERGFLYMKDRTSDMIITGGYNVYPREVEDVLTEHPAVAECSPKTAVGKLNRKALRDMLAG